MIDPTLTSRMTSTQTLNSTSLSKNILRLFEQEKQTPEPGLLVVALVLWVRDNPQGRDPAWVDAVAAAATQAESENPEAAYENLADPNLEQATSLQEAASLVMSLAREFVAAPD